MTSQENPVFFYPGVLNQEPPAIYKKGSPLAPYLDKPDGFRIPLIYFAWGVLRGSRNLHHHPDNDEVFVVLEGNATVRLYGPGKPEDRYEGVYEVSAGDFVVFPQGWVHSVEEKGKKNSLKVLVVFNNQEFVSVEDSREFVLPNDDDGMSLGENAGG